MLITGSDVSPEVEVFALPVLDVVLHECIHLEPPSKTVLTFLGQAPFAQFSHSVWMEPLDILIVPFCPLGCRNGEDLAPTNARQVQKEFKL